MVLRMESYEHLKNKPVGPVVHSLVIVMPENRFGQLRDFIVKHNLDVSRFVTEALSNLIEKIEQSEEKDEHSQNNRSMDERQRMGPHEKDPSQV
jgi:hypothetical protein